MFFYRWEAGSLCNQNWLYSLELDDVGHVHSRLSTIKLENLAAKKSIVAAWPVGTNLRIGGLGWWNVRIAEKPMRFLARWRTRGDCFQFFSVIFQQKQSLDSADWHMKRLYAGPYIHFNFDTSLTVSFGGLGVECSPVTRESRVRSPVRPLVLHWFPCYQLGPFLWTWVRNTNLWDIWVRFLLLC